MSGVGGGGAGPREGELAGWQLVYDRVDTQVEALVAGNARLEARNGIQHEYWDARDNINVSCLHKAELSRSRWEAACKELLPGDHHKLTELLESDLEDSRSTADYFEIENSELKIQVDASVELCERTVDREQIQRDLRELRNVLHGYETLCADKDMKVSTLLAENDSLRNQLRELKASTSTQQVGTSKKTSTPPSPCPLPVPPSSKKRKADQVDPSRKNATGNKSCRVDTSSGVKCPEPAPMEPLQGKEVPEARGNSRGSHAIVTPMPSPLMTTSDPRPDLALPVERVPEVLDKLHKIPSLEAMPKKRKAKYPSVDADEGEKIKRNRASPLSLTLLYDYFTEGQKKAAISMGMGSMMQIQCPNLNNGLVLWLGKRYEPKSRCLVIPGRGRIKLDEDLVFSTMGLPKGPIPVPYGTDNNKAEKKLFHVMFPHHSGSQPKVTYVWKQLKDMKTHEVEFKRMLIMYIICAVLAPTTSLKVSNRCYPVMVRIKDVHRMNFCKFVADRLHDALSSGKLNKGCHLHLMLSYLEHLSIDNIDVKVPREYFACEAWTNELIEKVLAADMKLDGTFGNLELVSEYDVNFNSFGGIHVFNKLMGSFTADNCDPKVRSNVENLVRHFASEVMFLLGSFVKAWTRMTEDDSEDDELGDEDYEVDRRGKQRKVSQDVKCGGISTLVTDTMKFKKKMAMSMSPAAGDGTSSCVCSAAPGTVELHPVKSTRPQQAAVVIPSTEPNVNVTKGSEKHVKPIVHVRSSSRGKMAIADGVKNGPPVIPPKAKKVRSPREPMDLKSVAPPRCSPRLKRSEPSDSNDDFHG